MKVVILKEKDIKEVFSMADAIQASKDALEIYSKGGTNIPLRTNLDIAKSEGQSLYMTGYAEEADALGVKIVSVYPNNIEMGIPSVPATMVLLNEKTGQVCSMMDGTYLTMVRTGAVAGAATDILANKDSKIFALFGTGGQAEGQLEAVLTVREIEEVRVFDISQERATEFANKMADKFKGKFKAKFVVAKTSDQAIDNADIITTATTSPRPTFNGELVKKGAHINGVGSYTPNMQEVDEHTILNSDKVYVDTRDGALNESGDLIVPINNKKCTEDIVVGELGEVIIGKAPSRENCQEITFFKSVGSAVLDIVTARRIYESALAKGVGQIIEF